MSEGGLDVMASDAASAVASTSAVAFALASELAMTSPAVPDVAGNCPIPSMSDEIGGGGSCAGAFGRPASGAGIGGCGEAWGPASFVTGGRLPCSSADVLSSTQPPSAMLMIGAPHR
jgi:hypothetical protein